MSDDDITVEPIKGLPETPPDGEEILWQGRPNWRALARESLMVNWVIGYFLVLAVWQVALRASEVPLGIALYGGVPYLLLGLGAAGIILVIAYVQARTTVYTITTSRVVMRIGVALTITLNLPFREIGTASLDMRKRGTGTIVMETLGKARISYLVLWPHARPLKFNPAQPALRCIDRADRVAALLSEAADARLSVPQVTKDPIGQAVAAE
ncbi:MAG: PH domain-containing protein [Rhodobacteraceae bacterium]|nr:PH domain-containing protein [Paracoccaceae bacterium]